MRSDLLVCDLTDAIQNQKPQFACAVDERRKTQGAMALKKLVDGRLQFDLGFNAKYIDPTRSLVRLANDPTIVLVKIAKHGRPVSCVRDVFSHRRRVKKAMFNDRH